MDNEEKKEINFDDDTNNNDDKENIDSVDIYSGTFKGRDSLSENNIVDLVRKNVIDRTIIIGSEKLKDVPCFKFLNYGNTYEEISHNIFTLLRKADKYNANLIIIESVKQEGLGLAIFNRLIRASGYNYISE